MIFFNKKLFKILFSFLVIAFLILAPYPLFTKIYNLNYSLNGKTNVENSEVLELWHIETFEGGSVSRTRFLEKRCQEFEKEHKGVFVVVKTLSLEQLKLNLNSNKKPNLISFSIGVEDLFLEDIINISNNYGVREDLCVSSKINGKLKALPYILGGYSLISNKESLFNEDIVKGLKESDKNKLIYSNLDSNLPLLSLFINNIKLNPQEQVSVDGFDAYDKFINNKFCALLGTQRDFYRCKNRENNFKMSANYNILGGFSDLIQYMSIFKSEPQKEKLCLNFLEYLVSEKVQQKLENINMFPVLNKNIYSDESYKEFNKILLNKLSTINAFTKCEDIEKLKNLLTDFVFNNKDNKNEILKFINV